MPRERGSLVEARDHGHGSLRTIALAVAREELKSCVLSPSSTGLFACAVLVGLRTESGAGSSSSRSTPPVIGQRLSYAWLSLPLEFTSLSFSLA